MYFVIPYIYSIFCILIPTYLLDNYLTGAILLFWIPSLILFSYLYDYIRAKELLSPFIILFLVMLPGTTAWELFFMEMDTWYFDIYKLIGIKLFGYPIEEFVFWYGAAPCQVLVFLYHLKKLDEIDDFKAFIIMASEETKLTNDQPEKTELFIRDAKGRPKL